MRLLIVSGLKFFSPFRFFAKQKCVFRCRCIPNSEGAKCIALLWCYIDALEDTKWREEGFSMSFFDCNGTIHDDQASLGQSWFISKSLFHTKGHKNRQTDGVSFFGMNCVRIPVTYCLIKLSLYFTLRSRLIIIEDFLLKKNISWCLKHDKL